MGVKRVKFDEAQKAQLAEAAERERVREGMRAEAFDRILNDLMCLDPKRRALVALEAMSYQEVVLTMKAGVASYGKLTDNYSNDAHRPSHQSATCQDGWTSPKA